ncbi:hypothetical protein BKA69DRAFT_1035630 [Paraphysoderma sedebokerense]|nr:hypothetical protein BKA69DRAFT_1035630 [Paraphysoderma sedebokerense]
MRYQTREHQECQKQISEDIDSEIQNQEKMYENILKTELDLCLRLKGENGIMKKRFLTFNKEIEDSKNEIIRLKENETKLRKVLVTLEKEMSNKRREMAERDKGIQDQEKRMYELKKKNQELEKFRFVLDFKIKHLKTQIEPKEQEISNMTKQISVSFAYLSVFLMSREINEALESLHRSERIMIEERQILQDSLTTAKDDYRNEYRRKRELIHLIKQIQTDLTYAIDFIQDPAVLKKSVENLHVKYCQKMPPNPPPLVDQPAAKENERQVRYLQNSITRLRQEADTQAKTFRQNNLNLVKQNLELIHEVKKLRAIKMGKVEVTDLTYVLNTLPALPMSSRGKEEIAVDMSAYRINENGDTTVDGTQNGTNEEIILRLPQLAI